MRILNKRISVCAPGTLSSYLRYQGLSSSSWKVCVLVYFFITHSTGKEASRIVTAGVTAKNGTNHRAVVSVKEKKISRAKAIVMGRYRKVSIKVFHNRPLRLVSNRESSGNNQHRKPIGNKSRSVMAI